MEEEEEEGKEDDPKFAAGGISTTSFPIDGLRMLSSIIFGSNLKLRSIPPSPISDRFSEPLSSSSDSSTDFSADSPDIVSSISDFSANI